MKIAVYDKVNPARLLGHLEVYDRLQGYRYEVALMDTFSLRDLYMSVITPSVDDGPRRIRFDIDVRQHSEAKQIDFATREIVTIERKCLLTDEPLDVLIKLDRFTLPEETDYEADQRRRLRRNVT